VAVEISAKLVKELRDKTGAGMMDCKKALKDAEGGLDEAVKILREKGIAKADKRSDRAAADGLIFSAIGEGGSQGVILELNCETDFVARTDDFQAVVSTMAEEIAANSGAENVDALMEMDSKSQSGKKIKELITDAITKLGENIKFPRFEVFNLQGSGAIGTYIHLGSKIGVMIEIGLEKADNAKSDKVTALAKELSMQIAASRPTYVSRDEVPQTAIDEEKEILVKQAENDPKNAGKPREILEKIVVGRLGKMFYEDNCLLDQPSNRDPKQKIKDVINAVSKEIDDKITVRRFVRYQVGG
jgi:elongation factor Ts